MDRAPAPRAVVFALEDLPAADRQYILSLATHLRLHVRPESWRAPLVLTANRPPGNAAPSSAAAQRSEAPSSGSAQRSEAPSSGRAQRSEAPMQMQMPMIDQPAPLPGLLSDAELSAAGPSLMLLSVRLLMADAYHWPELRWLGIAEDTGHAGHVLYAADPGRWTPAALANELSERGFDEVQRGLCPHPQRPPVSPGDRVPMLGLQVPVLGSKDPVAGLRDLRPPEQRRHRFAGVKVPLGMVPGNLTDRHRLYFQVSDATLARDADGGGDRGRARVDLLCIDGALGETLTAQLEVTLSDLSAALPVYSFSDSSGDSYAERATASAPGLAHDPAYVSACHPAADRLDAGPATSDALAELLRETLPGCLLLTPRGEVLVLDLYRLGLRARPVSAACLAGLRHCAAPPRPGAGAPYEDEGQQLLDPAGWDIASLSGLLHPDEIRLSHGGRFVSLRFCGIRDGLPIDAVVLLDSAQQRGARSIDSAQQRGAPSIDSAQQRGAPSIDSAQQRGAPSIDTPGPAATLLSWPVLLDGPAATLSISPDERVVALFTHDSQTAFALHDEALPPLSPACVSPDMDSPAADWIDAHADDLLFFKLPAPGRGDTDGSAQPAALLPHSSASLPNALRKPGPVSLYFLPDSATLVCHQPVGNLLCTIELPPLSATPGSELLKTPATDSDRHRFPPRAVLRATTAADLLALLTADGGQPLRRLLRAAGHCAAGPGAAAAPSSVSPTPATFGDAQPGDDIQDPSPALALAFIDLAPPAQPGPLAAVAALDPVGLLRAPLPKAAQAVLAGYLATRPRTFASVQSPPVPLAPAADAVMSRTDK